MFANATNLLLTIQIPFFDDVGAVTLQYFDSLFQRDNLQKSQFYKSLPKVLPKLPKVDTFGHNGCVPVQGQGMKPGEAAASEAPPKA